MSAALRSVPTGPRRIPFGAAGLAALPLAAMLGGCLPAPYGPYYRPSSPDPASTISRANCGGKAGPPTRLAIPAPGGLKLSVTAEKIFPERNRPDRPLRITIDAPPAARFRLLSDQIEIATTVDGRGQRVTPAATVQTRMPSPVDGWVDFASSGPTTAEVARRLADAAPDARFALLELRYANLKGFAPPAIALSIPPIESGGRRLTLPVQHLRSVPAEKGRFSTVYRSQEQSEALRIRHLACKAERPAADCDAILRYDERSFGAEAGDFLVHGRVSHIGQGSAATLLISLEVSARTIERWRLTEPAVRVADTGTGDVRAVGAEHASTSWRLNVPLSTEIRAADAAGASTRFDIEASLGEHDAPRYRIRLPRLSVDGVEHPLHPIDLERRLLDGGIEPFNC